MELKKNIPKFLISIIIVTAWGIFSEYILLAGLSRISWFPFVFIIDLLIFIIGVAAVISRIKTKREDKGFAYILFGLLNCYIGSSGIYHQIPLDNASLNRFILFVLSLSVGLFIVIDYFFYKKIKRDSLRKKISRIDTVQECDATEAE